MNGRIAYTIKNLSETRLFVFSSTDPDEYNENEANGRITF